MAKGKGIEIEFRSDTTQLDKALRTIRSEAKAVDQELQSVNRLLKFNPKNTELLSQKQQVLKDKVAQTEKSLDELRKTEEQLKNAGVDKNSAEFREVRRQIIEADSKLAHYKKELDKLKYVKLTALGKQFEDVGKKVKATGDAMTKYITGPIAAAGTASGAAWQTTQDALNEVTKLTGASGQDLVDMQTIVKDLATTMPADMSDIATAVGEVNTRFGLTGDALEDAAEQFVKFSQINGTDVTTSIDQVQKAMSAYGLDASETSSVLDVLTRTSQNTGVSVDKLTSGLISNGTAFQEMDLNMTQSAMLMGQLEKSGANMETVTNGMRRALKTAAKEGRPVNDVLAELQDTILNDTTGVEGLQAAYDVFGKSGDQIYGAIKAGTLDFKALGEAADDSAGILDQTFDAVQTPAQQAQKILNQLKLLGYDIAQAVLPVVSNALDKLMAALEKLNKRWNALAPETQKKIIAITLAIAAIGPALSTVGRVMMGFGKILQSVGTIAGGLSRALTFLAANPVALVIAGIAALVAAFVILWNKSEAFRGFFIGIWNSIKTKVQAFVAWFKTTKDKITGTFSGIPEKIKGYFGETWKGIKDTFSGWAAFWSGLWSTMKAKIGTITSGIKDGVIDGIKAGINGALSLVENIVNSGIRLINKAIKLANKLPGVNVGLVEELDLPQLAKGGVLRGAQTVIAGEAGPEAIIPLDRLFAQMDKMADQISGTAGGSVVVNVYGAAGQSAAEIAAAVERRLIDAQKRRRLAWQ